MTWLKNERKEAKPKWTEQPLRTQIWTTKHTYTRTHAHTHIHTPVSRHKTSLAFLQRSTRFRPFAIFHVPPSVPLTHDFSTSPANPHQTHQIPISKGVHMSMLPVE
ncbi:hypothetical protein LIA77_00290 [Sarocladium implicatum]|nr:hypothetical protein LIA77_00290 [Sarocladium implicatum]